MNPDLGTPLSEEELDRLSAFLDSPALFEGAMDLVEAHGFLTAIVSAPSTLMPSRWQPLLFGGPPQFESLEQAQEVFGLLTRMNNEIAHDLLVGSFEPLGYPDPLDLERWCVGYLAGARLDPAWVGRDDHGTALTFPMGVLAGELDLVGEADVDGNPIVDATKHEELYRERLPDYAQDLYDYFAEQRRAGLDRPPASKSSKVGRNDPCPCGSGKKFKKCCLSDLNPGTR